MLQSALRRSCSGRGAEEGTGVYECGGRLGGRGWRREEQPEGGERRTDARAPRGAAAAGGEGSMADRVASCGSLCDSTNLLLQYCNNGELTPTSHHITMVTERFSIRRSKYFSHLLWKTVNFYLIGIKLHELNELMTCIMGFSFLFSKSPALMSAPELWASVVFL